MTRRGRTTVGIALLALAAIGVGAAWWARTRPAEDPLAPAREAYERGDWASAEAASRSFLAEHREHPDALRLLARSAARQGRDDTSRRIYQRLGVETLAPEDHLVVALGLQREGRAAAARETLGFALQDDPSHLEARYELARMERENGHPNLAMDLLRPVAEAPAWAARGGVLSGLLNDRLHRPEAGADAIRSALAADPELKGAPLRPDEARKALARLLLKAGRPAEAKGPLGEVLARGADPEASWLLSRAAIQLGDEAAASAALAEAEGFGADRPEAPEPAPFVGAAKCAGCHSAIHDAQQSSHHAQTFHRGDDLADFTLPQGPLPDPHLPGVTHAMERTGQGIEVATDAGKETYRALIRYVMGSGNHARTFVGTSRKDDSMREFRLSSFSRAGLWDLTTGHSPRPGDPHDALGMKQSDDSLSDCLNCHTTDFRATLDRKGPQSLDRGIGCERCHGPGGNHVAAMTAGFPDPAIGRPRLASPSAVTTLCGDCHGVGNRTVPEDDGTFLLRFQATTLPKSRCVTATDGAVGCTTCHDPHRNAESSPAFYEAKCLACHGPIGDAKSPAEDGTRAAALPATSRRVPCPVDPRQGCVGCHMPSRPGMMPHSPFTDHHIRVPRGQAPKSP